MSIFIKELIKNKVKQLNKDDLLQVSKQYGFSISDKEAGEIIQYIRQNEFDVFSKKDIEHLYRKLANITNETTASQAKNLLEKLISDYGLSNYFY